MAQGRIANRCDYRRLVTSGENLENCRDANEDHGKILHSLLLLICHRSTTFLFHVATCW